MFKKEKCYNIYLDSSFNVVKMKYYNSMNEALESPPPFDYCVAKITIVQRSGVFATTVYDRKCKGQCNENAISEEKSDKVYCSLCKHCGRGDDINCQSSNVFKTIEFKETYYAPKNTQKVRQLMEIQNKHNNCGFFTPKDGDEE